MIKNDNGAWDGDGNNDNSFWFLIVNTMLP